MPLIKDVRRRRLAYERRSIQQLGAGASAEAGFAIEGPDLRDLNQLPTIYVNRELLLRVNARIVDDIQAGMTEWPEETQFSRFHFRSNDSAIVNLADYADFVENMHANNQARGYAVPTSFEAQPIKRYVEEHWPIFAAEDIAAINRRRDRGG